jgi:hypothetical protein
MIMEKRSKKEQKNYKANQELGRQMNGRAQNICYVCQKTDTRSGEKLSRSCGCNGKTNPIHFSCIADLIVNYSDPKCPFCKRNFTDPRIRRYPTFNVFLTRGPGVVFTILFFVVNMHLLSERIYVQNLQIKQYVQRFGIFRARMVVSIIVSLFNSILFLLALQCYRIWFRKQPKTIVLNRIINGEPFAQHLDLNVYNKTPNGTQR